MKQTFGIPASIQSFVPGMFGSRTSWSSGRYISTFRFPKEMHIFWEPGRWKWQNRKLKEHLPWGRSQKNEGCTGAILLYQFTNFLYLAESCGWVQQNRNIFSLQKHHIRISRVFATLMRPIVRNTECDPLAFTTPIGATHCFLQHLQFYLNPTDWGREGYRATQVL